MGAGLLLPFCLAPSVSSLPALEPWGRHPPHQAWVMGPFMQACILTKCVTALSTLLDYRFLEGNDEFNACFHRSL